MLSGVKFISRDQLSTDLGSSQKDKKKRKSNSKYDNSSEDEAEKTKRSSRRSKKRYSSDDSSSTSESESNSDYDQKKRHKKRRSKKKKKRYSSESYSLSDSESKEKRRKGRREHQGKKKIDDDSGSSVPPTDKELARKQAGLDWMLKPTSDPARMPTKSADPPEEPQVEEMKTNPKELNPYLNDNGSGYPEDVDQKAGGNQLLSSSVVGDGGASWRMKALKRAREQAAREGRKLAEVVEERWDSLGQLAVSAASCAAPAHAHLHAIKDRRRGVAEKHVPPSDDQNYQNTDKVHGGKREYLKDVSSRNPEMRAPKIHGSLSWKKKEHNMSKGDSELIHAAASCLNKFANDGSFMHELTHQQKDTSQSSCTNLEEAEHLESDMVSSDINERSEEGPVVKQTLTANQIAAKAMQLRMKGKHEEAEKLLKEAHIIKMNQENEANLARGASEGIVNRYAMRDLSIKQKNKEDDADRHLAQKIVHNKQYKISSQADDEYDFDDGPRKKRNNKRQVPEQSTERSTIVKHILTQQERCQFCFENPTRPRHLIVAIANFTYLMLPQSQPVVQGHCCILPMQHEASTRNVDDNVWVEIRNFKKCLIEMFGEQEKDVVFLETVMGLAKQRRHCLVECIPLPREIARQAPLYFKKAIDEAEEEWSQHNAKKLISTSRGKGLRNSIPKNFPYFYVEFGLDEGFVHVIDDEEQFKSNLGLNVIRGMLELPEEDMYRRRRHESMETQKKAVLSFARDWEPYDWTKELG